jgi:hypothetical protein
MEQNYMTMGSFAMGKKPEGDSAGKVAALSPKEKVVMSIYGGLAPNESGHNLKLRSRAVNTVSPATPEYLRWSESPITFDWMDHSDSIPKPRRFPLIVDLLVGMTRLTKTLMDRGSGLNLMYLNTFEGLELTRISSRAAHIHSTEWSRVSSLSHLSMSLCNGGDEHRPFQSQPAKDRNRAPYSRNDVFIGTGFEPPKWTP